MIPSPPAAFTSEEKVPPNLLRPLAVFAASILRRKLKPEPT